jgi:hypothetical protein
MYVCSYFDPRTPRPGQHSSPGAVTTHVRTHVYLVEIYTCVLGVTGVSGPRALLCTLTSDHMSKLHTVFSMVA